MEDDTSANEAPAGSKKEIKDYLNSNLFNDVKTLNLMRLITV